MRIELKNGFRNIKVSYMSWGFTVDVWTFEHPPLLSCLARLKRHSDLREDKFYMITGINFRRQKIYMTPSQHWEHIKTNSKCKGLTFCDSPFNFCKPYELPEHRL